MLFKNDQYQVGTRSDQKLRETLTVWALRLVDTDKPGNPEKTIYKFCQKQELETEQLLLLHCSLYEDKFFA